MKTFSFIEWFHIIEGISRVPWKFSHMTPVGKKFRKVYFKDFKGFRLGLQIAED